jgi:hypothetical protein
VKRIPISAAKTIADKYGYDQVIVIARKVGDDPDPHGEHCTTYGVTKEHCKAAARIGDFLKYKIMGWEKPKPTIEELEAILRANDSPKVHVLPDGSITAD